MIRLVKGPTGKEEGNQLFTCVKATMLTFFFISFIYYSPLRNDVFSDPKGTPIILNEVGSAIFVAKQQVRILYGELSSFEGTWSRKEDVAKDSLWLFSR